MKKFHFFLSLLIKIPIMALTSLNIGAEKSRKSVVPIPLGLAGLPTIQAEPWLRIDASPGVLLEGPAFDRQGILLVTSVEQGRIYRVTQQKQISILFENKDVRPTGCAFHKDGRLFVVCMTGELIAMNPDGSGITYIAPRYQGKPEKINDLVFDANGNLYVTDFTGNGPNPTGGVYRFSSDFTTVKPVAVNLAGPNGISLAPEGNVLWVGETPRNTIIRIALLEDGVTVNPLDGLCYAYYSTGAPGGPDSNKVDAEGNLYQCIMAQGRVVVLNNRGIPVANVVVPGRDEGKQLRTTNLAFRPGTREAHLLASGDGGAWIYRFRGLAKGLPLFSHQ